MKQNEMSTEITTIITKKLFRSVNCYLIKNGTKYILVDSGFSDKRSDLEKQLESAGCSPGNLTLIVVTHGDFDHIGNCAYLREKFGAKIAMHYDDSGMAERGDMFWNRKKANILIRILVNAIFRLKKSDRFKPDVYVEDGYDLSAYGLDAKVLHIPGHSKGSIGILTAGGDLFCGDLIRNMGKPALSSLMDDPAAANASVEKLKKLQITTVYPGHGKPFLMRSFT
jgi:glyoxylase-like metal-dependent hydrolase (beta-lactamase superfamily II)